jgi:hypothetical protein
VGTLKTVNAARRDAAVVQHDIDGKDPMVRMRHWAFRLALLAAIALAAGAGNKWGP